MAYIFGLIISLLSAFVLAETIPANTNTPSNYDSVNQRYVAACPNPWAACSASPMCAYGNTLQTGFLVGAYPTGIWYCSFSTSDITYTCPAGQGWTLNGSSCDRVACPSGQSYSNGVCSVDCNALKGKSFSGNVPATSSGAYVSLNGCGASVVSASNQCKVNGIESICGVWQYTGTSEVSAPVASTAGTNTAKTCPVNQCSGEFNGTTICLPCSDSSPKVETKVQTTTKPDGTVVKEVTVSTSNETTTTTKTDVITSAPGGGSSVTAEGDAVEKPKDKTAFDEPVSIPVDEPKVPNNDQSISGVLSAQGSLGGGSCPADLIVSLPHGQTMTIPFSTACPYLQIMGNVMVLIASISAVRIVGVF